MSEFMIKWDDDYIFIQAPRSPESMELARKVLEIGSNPVAAKKVKTTRPHEKQLQNLIGKVLDSDRWKNLDAEDEDGVVADFYAKFPDVEVNDHRLRRYVRQIIKKGVVA